MPRGMRAVVADDSHFMRTVIADILEEGDIEVVGEARNGREAVELVLELDPDVVTMDVEMPEMNGVEAVEEIMDRHPTPILMLSAHTEENADVTFEALDRGAVDFLAKPGGEVTTKMSTLEDRLVEMVRSVARSDPSGGSDSTAAGRRDRATGGASATRTATGDYVSNPTLVLAASTGGPKTVERVLSELPAAADLRILLVQHMSEEFTGRFAERLDANSQYDIAEATDGARIGGGQGLVAAGGYHMAVSNYAGGRLRVRLTEDPPEHGVRPAADVTMRTAAETIDDPMVGVVLTGMGADGAEGVRALESAGAHTIAQDEATSTVYSMPRNAAETGCVDDVLPIDEIPSGILERLRTGAN